MRIEVSQEPITDLDEYSTIPIAFEVASVLEVTDPGAGNEGFILTDRSLDLPYVKDYDAIDGERPADWAKHFDMSNWGMFAARVEGQLIGGAVVALNTPGATMLEGRKDLAVLWDIRVKPQARGQGVGSALFSAVEEWARIKGCQQLKVETQNINVSSCRFYERQGCLLKAAHRFAYPEFPDEVQLLWYKELSGSASSG